MTSISQKYQRRKNTQLTIAIGAGLVALSLFLGQNAPSWLPVFFTTEKWDMIGFGLIILAVVISLINWRCPNCNAYLGSGVPKRCAKCGVDLTKD